MGCTFKGKNREAKKKIVPKLINRVVCVVSSPNVPKLLNRVVSQERNCVAKSAYPNLTSPAEQFLTSCPILGLHSLETCLFACRAMSEDRTVYAL